MTAHTLGGGPRPAEPAITPELADTVTVTVRYFAAACAATGTEEEQITVSAPATVGGVLADAAGRHAAGVAAVLARCSFLLDGVAVHGPDAPVVAPATIDVLPPFAGG